MPCFFLTGVQVPLINIPAVEKPSSASPSAYLIRRTRNTGQQAPPQIMVSEYSKTSARVGRDRDDGFRGLTTGMYDDAAGHYFQYQRHSIISATEINTDNLPAFHVKLSCARGGNVALPMCDSQVSGLDAIESWPADF
jgi:hypothetical protein